MAHIRANIRHEADLLRRTTLVLAVGTVWVTFLALALGATIYDVGEWLRLWRADPTHSSAEIGIPTIPATQL